MAKPIYEQLISAVISTKIGRKEEGGRMIEIIREQINNDHQFRTMVHLGHMADKARLYDIVDKLANSNSASLRDSALPIGTTSGPIQIGEDPSQGKGIRIDEATAEVLRSKEPLVLGNQENFVVRFVGVDRSTGSCRVEMHESEALEIKGKITDPALELPGNVYTESLNNHSLAMILAKPVFENGIIKSLFISDGRSYDAG